MPVLTYHSINPDWSSALSVPPDVFGEHCAWLSNKTLIDAHEAAVRIVRHGSLARGEFAITFDDGFADLLDHALPILLKHRIPATVFVVAGTLTGKKVDWLDDKDPPVRTLTAEEICEMRSEGIRIGSHSDLHLDLIELTESDCERDLRESRERLEDLVHEPVGLLAYPRGLHDERVRRAAERAGYAFAFGTTKRLGPPGPFAIARVGVYGRESTLKLTIKSSRLFAALKRL